MYDLKFIAHVTDDGRTHGIDDHLRGTAELAARFAAQFSYGEKQKAVNLRGELVKLKTRRKGGE